MMEGTPAVPPDVEAPVRSAGQDSDSKEASHADSYTVVAVQALALLIAAIGLFLLLFESMQRLAGPLALVAQSRALMGACLAAGGAGGWLLSRRGWNAASATVSLTLALLSIMLHAWYSGLGTHAIALGGTVLLIAMAGVLVNLPTAIALGAVNLMLIAGLEIAERRSLISPAAALAHPDPESRALSFGLLMLAALITAWIVRRQLLGTVSRAQQQERRMARLLRLGSDFTWEMDRQGRFTWLSSSFEAHTGHTIEEAMRLDEPDGPRLVRDAQWHALAADMRARRPYRDRTNQFIAADGREMFICGSGEPVFDDAGHHVGWWGVSRNATEEVLAQRTLQRSQAMLDRLFRLSPDAVCVAGMRDGRMLLANPAFLQFVGLDEPQVMGRNGVELGFWRDAEPMLALRRAITDKGWVRDFRTVAFAADGSRRFVLITAAAFDWDGRGRGP